MLVNRTFYIYLSEQGCEDPWLFVGSTMSPRAKTFGKHWSIGTILYGKLQSFAPLLLLLFLLLLLVVVVVVESVVVVVVVVVVESVVESVVVVVVVVVESVVVVVVVAVAVVVVAAEPSASFNEVLSNPDL